jgi:hypothetical protein
MANVEQLLSVTLIAILVDLITVSVLFFGKRGGESVRKWYKQFRTGAACMDVMSLIIASWFAVMLGRNITEQIAIVIAIQILHDLIVGYFVKNSHPSQDTLLSMWKEYANEIGFVILLVDALMLIATVYFSQTEFVQNMNKETKAYAAVVFAYLLLLIIHSF